jgi:hypothetical protein
VIQESKEKGTKNETWKGIITEGDKKIKRKMKKIKRERNKSVAQLINRDGRHKGEQKQRRKQKVYKECICVFLMVLTINSD